jgi:hypothetical protein
MNDLVKVFPEEYQLRWGDGRVRTRWHVATLNRFDEWHQVTVMGYRSKKRAERKAARLERRLVKDRAAMQKWRDKAKSEHARIENTPDARRKPESGTT